MLHRRKTRPYALLIKAEPERAWQFSQFFHNLAVNFEQLFHNSSVRIAGRDTRILQKFVDKCELYEIYKIS
jgi:hypothetical protein